MQNRKKQSRFDVWVLAARPKTLWAAFAPVLMGTAMAAASGVLHVPSALACFAFAFLIQIGTNFCNDYADFKKGADTEARVGPLRVTQAGLIRPEVILRATVWTFALALVVGSGLAWRAGWPLVALGVLCVVSGVLYTAGPRPLGYLGLGDVFVLVFFGPVAVAGTYFVQAKEVGLDVVLAGLSPGFISVAILVVNNLRDMKGDAAAGKRTLAVRFGAGFARAEYVICIFAALLMPTLLVLLDGASLYVLMVWLVLPPTVPLVRTVLTQSGVALNPVLGHTAKLLLFFSILFSVGWNL